MNFPCPSLRNPVTGRVDSASIASGRLFAQTGFSLIELMVSIVLGLVLMTGVINVYLDSKRNYSYEDEQARLQENGRFALNVLKRELQHVGFFGGVITGGSGATPVAIGGTDCVANWATDTTAPLEFIDDYSSGAFTTINGTTWTACLGAIQAETDIISVKRTAGDYTLKNGEFNPALTAAATTQWYLRVKNAEDAVEREFVYIGAGTIPSADATAGSLVDYWEYYASVFYIRDYSTTAGDGIPTLCVSTLQAAAMASTAGCLVEGVEDMQIEFGIDTNADGTPDQYKTTPTAGDMSNIVTARIFLLVRSVNAVPTYTNTKTYTLGTKAVAAKDDRFMRAVYSTTVQVRNISYGR